MGPIPRLFQSHSKWPFHPWFVNGGDPITTYDTWDDPPKRDVFSTPGEESLELARELFSAKLNKNNGQQPGEGTTTGCGRYDRNPEKTKNNSEHGHLLWFGLGLQHGHHLNQRFILIK